MEGMHLYNFYAYLKQQFPGIKFVCGGEPPNNLTDYILIIDNDGPRNIDTGRIDYAFQLLSFYNDQTAGRKAVATVHAGIKRLFNVELPAITIDGVAYQECIAWKIAARQAPFSLGTDDMGRYMISVNYNVTIV